MIVYYVRYLVTPSQPSHMVEGIEHIIPLRREKKRGEWKEKEKWVRNRIIL